jgi:hypothetical protein
MQHFKRGFGFRYYFIRDGSLGFGFSVFLLLIILFSTGFRFGRHSIELWWEIMVVKNGGKLWWLKMVGNYGG